MSGSALATISRLQTKIKSNSIAFNQLKYKKSSKIAKLYLKIGDLEDKISQVNLQLYEKDQIITQLTNTIKKTLKKKDYKKKT